MSNEIQARLESEVSAWWASLTEVEASLVGDEGLADVQALNRFLTDLVLSIQGECEVTDDGVQIRHYELVLAYGGPTITAKSYAGAWASLELVGEWQGCEKVTQNVWCPTLGQMLGEMITAIAG